MKFRTIQLFFLFLFLITAYSTFAQQDTIKSELTFDFGFTRGHNINLWPLFKRYKTKDSKEIQVLFPLYKYQKYYNIPSKHSHLFPIYWNDSSAAGKDLRLITLYYPSLFRSSYEYAPGIQSYKFVDIAPEINFVEITKSKDGMFIQNNMLFLLWYKNDQILHKSHLIFFPVYWSFHDTLTTSHTFFPLTSWGTYHNNRDHYFAVTPLYWHFSKNDGYTNVLFPLWWNWKKIEESPLNTNYFHYGEQNTKYFNYVFPVFISFRDNTRNTKILFPLVWSIKSPWYSSFTLLPLLSTGHSADLSMCYLMFTPLFWHTKKGDLKRNILFPLYWNKKDGKDEDAVSSNIVFPIYWAHKDRFKNNKILFPLLWSIKNQHYQSFTFIPLVSMGQSADSTRKHFMLTPLFWHLKRIDEQRNILFPIWWYHKQGKGYERTLSNVIFPVYWHIENNFNKTQILLPVLWNLKSPFYSSFTLAPLFSTGSSPDGTASHIVITPFFWHVQKRDMFRNTLFPIWFFESQGEGENKTYSNIIFPLYWRYKNYYKDNTVLFPIHWSLHDSKYTSYTFFPFFSKGSSTDGKRTHLMVSPLYWRIVNGENYKRIFFPFWWDKKKEFGENTAFSKLVVPFYWSYHDKSKNNQVVFPFFWSLKDTSYNTLIVAPLFSFGHSPDKKNGYIMASPLFWHFKSPTGYRNILFPVWWNKKQGLNENEVYSNVVFPLYWSYRDKNKNNKILLPVLWSLKNKRYASFTLFPVFSKGISADSTSGHFTLTPLYWHFKQSKGYKNILFPIWWNKKWGSGKNQVYSNIIFPVYWSHKDRWETRKVLFPILWKIKDQKYSSFTFIPFFSKGSSSDSTRNHLMITPLFWNLTDADDHRTILFPIWWERKHGYQEYTAYTKILFPVYWSYKDFETDNKVLFPIHWSFKNSKYHSYTFPFLFSNGKSTDGLRSHLMVGSVYWNFKDKYSQKQVLFPIWWNKKRFLKNDTLTSNVIFPLYWSYKDNEKKQNILFPFIWNYKNAQRHSFTLVPLFSYTHSMDKQKKVIMVTPLFWQIKNKDKTRNILFPVWWYWHKKSGIGDEPETSNVIFPIYRKYKNKYVNNTIIFPIIWRLKNTFYQSFTMLPLFSEGHSPDFKKHHLVVTPLFWHIQKLESKRTILFPIFGSYSDTTGRSKVNSFVFLFRSKKEQQRKTVSFLWPFCESTRDINYRYFRFAPILWYKKSPDLDYFSIQPFYYQSRDSASKNYYIFWQLYTYKNYPNIKKSYNVLWKVISWDKYVNKDYEFRIFYLLFAQVKKQGSIERSLFPLYQYTYEPNGNKSFALLFYFYNSFRRKIPETTEFYMEQRIFWFIRLRSNYKILQQKGIKDNLIKQ